MTGNLPSSGSALAGPVAALRRVVDTLDDLSRWVLVVTMAGMALLVSAQVFMRYGLNSSIDSADELSRLFFVWSIFLAIPHGLRRGVHVGIDVIARMMPFRVQDVLHRVSALAGLVLMLAVFVTALGAASDKWGELMPTLPVTAALYYVPVCICAGHAAFHLSLFVLGGVNVWGADAWKEAQS